MAPRVQAVCAILLLALLAGCTKKPAVVVHVFRDPAAPMAAQLKRAVAHFQSLNMKGTNGRLIVVADTETTDYRARLADLGTALSPDLVFLNSRGDADKNPRLQEELTRALEVGGEGRRCVAFIPSWVTGDERTAAQTFLNFLISSGELW
jgi:hypothetical protein